MALIKHFETDTWAYYSPFAKVSPNTYATRDIRKFYIGGPGVKAAYKIDLPVPIGTRITVDEEETNPDIGFYRIYKFPDIAALVPAELTAFMKEHYPNAPEEWQLWLDWSGAVPWIDPVIPEPEPEPEPIEPEPEPVPDPDDGIEIAGEFTIFGWTVTVWRQV